MRFVTGTVVLGLAVAGTGFAQFEADVVPPRPLVSLAATDSAHDYYPEVATDGAGTWVTVWRAIEGGQNTILLSRSGDDGARWSEPRALIVSIGGTINRHPFVATDRQGVWITAWESEDDLGGTLGTDFDILFSRSADDGRTWTAPRRLDSSVTASNGRDGWPRLAVDAQRRWVVVWHSETDPTGTIGGDRDILVVRSLDGGSSWSAPAPLNATAAGDAADADDLFAQVQVNADGTWVAAWKCSNRVATTVDLLVARSEDAGTTWTVPETIQASQIDDNGAEAVVQIAAGRQRSWVAMWQTADPLDGTLGDDLDLFVSRSLDDGRTWSPPAPLNGNAATDTGHDGFAHIATDDFGDWIAAWQRPRDPVDTAFAIFVALSRDAGRSWTDPAPLHPDTNRVLGADFWPRVATPGDGRWRAIWMSSDPLDDTIDTDMDILVAEWAFCRIHVDGRSPTRIAMLPAAAAPTFEVITGSLAEVRQSGGFASASCLDVTAGVPVVDDLADPAPGEARFYLARARDTCTAQGFGNSGLQPDPREALEAANPCP